MEGRLPILTGSEDFLRGFEAGLIWAELNRGTAARIEADLRADNDEQYHVMALRAGYRLEWRRPAERPGVFEAVFTRA